jgi:L-ascorbate metabolism protein UlaG (beta-lactamase superfamily)
LASINAAAGFVSRRVKRWFLIVLSGVALVTACSAYVVKDRPAAYPASAQFKDGRFQNPIPRPPIHFWDSPKLVWTFFFDKPAGTVPDKPVPVLSLTRAELLAAPDNSVFRLAHSTLLFKIHNKFWITDPVFSDRASPVQWFGPKRFHAPPISLEELPPIEAVILSHNHYDHLDQTAVVKLAGKTKHFIAPLGVGDLLIAWGIDAGKVRQLDWWEATEIDSIRFVSTPAQHFSGRGPRDEDKTLWTSWVILEAGFRLFFSGDSGYFDGFKAIGDRYGPFDMTFLENGAYDPRWAYVHMKPEETVQAFRDLRGKSLFPIHNGTFDLSMHRWDDPFERITQLAETHGIALSTPLMGERVSFLDPRAGSPWWRN